MNWTKIPELALSDTVLLWMGPRRKLLCHFVAHRDLKTDKVKKRKIERTLMLSSEL